jgi:hypothetical protein
MAQYRVRWFVSPLHKIEITSSLVSGMASLAEKGEVDLVLEPLRSPEEVPHVMRWEVRDAASDEMRLVAIDEYDRGDRFDPRTLREVDLYLKRNFNRAALSAFPSEQRCKVHSSGITYGCVLAGTRWFLARAALACGRAHLGAFGWKGARSALDGLIYNARQIEGLLNTRDWERVPTDSIEEQVVYQTRIWPEEPDPTVDRRAVNEERVDLVRALRAEFGGPDLIGLIHTDFAAATAPDALLSRKVGRSEYARQLRTSLVAVNTHGLDGSAGFKVGESFAAGCALVSQPFVFEPPEPLVQEVHYLPFETPEECVIQCKRLFEDRALATRMRDANQEYYRRFLRPEAHAREFLERVFVL